MNRELEGNISPVYALDTQTISTNTTTAGNEIDTQGFDSLTLLPFTGVLTDGDYTLLIEETDESGSGYTAVADDDLTVTEASVSFTDDADDNVVNKIGYIGSKRFVKVSIVSTGTSSGAILGCLAVLGHPSIAPVA